MEGKNKSNTSKNNGNSIHLKVIQKIPKQHNGKHEIKELQKTATCGVTHTSESANVEVQNRFSVRKDITYSTNCKYGTVSKLYTQDTWFF